MTDNGLSLLDLFNRMAGDVKKQSENKLLFFDQDRPSISKFDEKTRKFTTSKTVNILNDSQFLTVNDQHQYQRYELFRQHEQTLPNELITPVFLQSASSSTSSIEQTNTFNYHRNQPSPIEDDDISEDLRSLTERLPDLCILDGEPMQFNNGTKFYCTIKDILTSDGEFWVERELSAENERKFRHFIDILSLFAVSYESLKQVYVGQLVALYYESSWHRALVVSRSEGPNITTQPSARVRLIDYGSSLYVNVAQLKWLPVQFYLFPFKAVECIFSEAVKPTFSDTVRLTFKQLVLNKRLRATIYDRDDNRVCILLKCKTEEGTINVYRYLRAHEHKSKRGRMLPDGDIVTCLRDTIHNNSSYLDQSILSNKTISATISVTLPILTPPSPIKLTRDQLQIRRAEINKIYKEPYDENNNSIHSNDMNQNGSMDALKDNKKLPSPSPQSTPFSASTVITPMPRLSFAQQ